ncbi:hypothetical protein RHDE110596_04010 [Prescottella defluvii]|nr:hypothetical protein [Prescottella defluvii]
MGSEEIGTLIGSVDFDQVVAGAEAIGAFAALIAAVGAFAALVI